MLTITIITITITLIFIDQISKLLVANLLSQTTTVTIIKNFFYLTYTNNDGAAFSILLGKRIFLILIALIIIIILIYYLKKHPPKNKLEVISISLLLGGSIGNLIDRIIRGYVIDFLDFKIFGYNYPIFNLADTFIVVGVFLILLQEIRKEKYLDSRNKWFWKKNR